MQGYKQYKGFIIAQAPMQFTCRDFWKMVYERECGVVMMLSDLVENGRVNRMLLQKIFPMQSGCKSYNNKLKGSGQPLPLLGQAVSHCFIGDYISILPLGDVKFEISLPCRRCATSTGLLGTPGGGRSMVNSMCLFSKPHSRMALYSACSVSPTQR